ncbi:MAG: polymerase sigma-70 factor, subfamily [Gaiellaceae bacterium]|nr:polymerase sigma-70 factor, subfamily [Gaiellaceae bacterium]
MNAQSGLPESYGKVFRFVRRRVGSFEDAQDLTQEVFAAAAARLDGCEPESSSLAWLYTVAKRRIIDEGRRSGRGHSVALELVAEPQANEARYGDDVAETLNAGLLSMPEGQRKVVVGRLLRGQSFGDLARELETSEEACRMRFMRGLQHLRQEFTRKGLEP